MNQKLNVTCATQESSNEVVFLPRANMGEENIAGSCVGEQTLGEVKSITINPNQGSLQTEAEIKISSLEDTLTEFMCLTQNEFL